MVRGVLPVFISMKMRYSPGLLSMAFDEMLCLIQQVASEQRAALFIQSSEIGPQSLSIGVQSPVGCEKGGYPPIPPVVDFTT